jgi:hypothetical protein
VNRNYQGTEEDSDVEVCFNESLAEEEDSSDGESDYCEDIVEIYTLLGDE